jgi:5'-nucleotidase
MSPSLENKLVIAVTSRALFDLEKSHELFITQGLQKYIEYQIAHEDEILPQGVAFPLVKRLLALSTETQPVEVILMSKNNPNTGLRIFNSIEHYGLNITRAVLTGGRPLHEYLKALNSDLFLSADDEDVQNALKHGNAAAKIYAGASVADDGMEEVRIAFDGDAVLFNDEAESVYVEQGLDEFHRSEAENSDIPLGEGPFKRFLEALNHLQKEPGVRGRIHTALFTARSVPAHKRAIKTFRAWGIDVDEAFFLGGLDKSRLLEVFKPHIFFDDQTRYTDSASRYVPTGHVPVGIRNREKP